MALPSTFTGSTYGKIEAALFQAVDKANGKLLATDAEGGIYYPRLTWGQMVALSAAWKRAAARSTLRWRGWYELMKYALGWTQAGDRFIMEKQWANTSADPASLALFWSEIGKLAGDLDAAGTKIAPLYVDWTWAGYEAAARDAWSQMKIEREAAPGSPAPALTPEASESSGWGGALILIALLIAAGMASKKGS
jgi:hypothetical protein